MGGQLEGLQLEEEPQPDGLDAVTNASISLASLISPETALIPPPFTIATTLGTETCFANCA